MTTKTTLACITLALSSAAHADFLSGNGLFKEMTGTSDIGQMFATGYVVGVHDATSGTNQHCVPKGVNAGQLSDVVRLWLRNNPAHRHLPAEQLVVFSLSVAFPCTENKPQSGRSL